MKFDRRLLINFDWMLLLLLLGLCVIGILNIYSAGYSLSDFKQETLYVKQAQWIMIGLVLMGITVCIDYHLICRYAYIIYAFSVLLLLLVALYGYTTHGSQRWIMIQGFSFQPSELVKLTTIIALAKYFDEHRIQKSYNLKELLIPFFIVFIPFSFILKQPDLGTALVLLIIFTSITFFVGVQWKSLVLAIVSVLIVTPFSWFFLKDYQRERIITFFNPESDPLGSGYHIIQSIIAVGSGGIIGKGYLKGTQTQLKFLPVQQTDFVFSVFAEEWGFMGALIVMVMFLALVLWCLKIALHSRDLLGMLISFGISMLIFWEVFINIGMVLGLLPVVGIPLPFLSYGGSSMIVLMVAMGFLMNISMRRFILHP
ncbi:MAG: rod shape-determining protein RodA [Deltaproteobacteria bacterium]|nr:rod shape-determining protein RodA [Deltaproteobacteria bacterium]